VTVILHVAACGRQPALLLRPWCRQDRQDLMDIYRDPVMYRSARNPIVTEQDAFRWLEAQQQGIVPGRAEVRVCADRIAPGRSSRLP
jgi:hypothetical protein